MLRLKVQRRATTLEMSSNVRLSSRQRIIILLDFRLVSLRRIVKEMQKTTHKHLYFYHTFVHFIDGKSFFSIFSRFGLTPQSKVWIGAWWIGFVFIALICLLLSIPILAYPSSLPGEFIVLSITYIL